MQEYSKSKLNRIKRGSQRASYDVEKINTILDAGFIGYVSYIYQDSAITIPMAYGRNDDKIYLHGSQANRMLLTLLETKKMSMTVMHLDGLILARSGLNHSVSYRSVTLFGSVKKVEDPKEKDEALFCIMEHMMEGRWDGVRPMYKAELNRTLIIEISIETASAKIRDFGIFDEPEDYDLEIWAGVVPIKQIVGYPIPDRGLPQKMKIPKHVLDYYQTHKE